MTREHVFWALESLLEGKATPMMTTAVTTTAAARKNALAMAMAIAAALVQFSASVSALISVSVTGLLLLAEMALFLLLRRVVSDGRGMCGGTREPFLLPHGPANQQGSAQTQDAPSQAATTTCGCTCTRSATAAVRCE